MRTSNKIFQICHGIAAPVFRPGYPEHWKTIGEWKPYQRWELAFALKFGGAEIVLLGDSDAWAIGDSMSERMQFRGRIIELGAPGSRFDHWTDYLESGHSLKFKTDIWSRKQVVHLGGNHVLQNKMDLLHDSMRRFHDRLPDCWNCTPPPIPSNYLRLFGAEAVDNLALLTDMIKTEWGAKCIDIQAVVKAWSSDPLAWLLVARDSIHYTSLATKNAIIPAIRNAIDD